MALDIFVRWEAPVERLGLPAGAWGGLKVTLVQTTGAGDEISRQNIFLFSQVLCHAACRQVEKHCSDAFIGVPGVEADYSKPQIDKKEKCPTVDFPPCYSSNTPHRFHL